ncbi:MAG: thiamine pyrophosphate-binding protein, partial [Syntrophomonadaceae bacterium]|nr:thiamine pyrophosphate-binding protein [Syntrophomonadaceae bacterium]
MIKAQDFVNSALKRGYNFWTGVPCSFIKPLINYVLQDPNLDYIGATSEGEAVGIAAGAYLAGRKTVVMCQNSGLGNTVNPLTSLNFPFRIPTMLIVTHRGALGLNDEPQHELMGQITGELLDVLRIPWEPFPQTISQIEAALQR